MILKSLEVENFRQFHGSQRLELSSGTEKNVTVIYGANGAGKTSLLNAFTWALYKQFSPAFEQPEHLINEHAWAAAKAGEEVSASATVEFEHEGRSYTVSRTTTDRKTAEGEPLRIRDAAVSVSFIDEYGEHHSRDDTSVGTINEVLPERLHRFFFFDGERIEQLVKDDAYAEIEEAIKGILGLQVVENAIRHTKEARKDLEKELREFGSDEDRALTDELSTVREGRTDLVDEVDQHRRNLKELDEERAEVDRRLAELQDVAQKQQEREELERDLVDTQRALQSSRGSLAAAVAREGWLAFAGGLAQQTVKLVDERRERGEIPRDLKLQFVEDLLDRGSCICGTELTPGGEAHTKVAGWRELAGDRDTEAAWMQLPASAKAIKTRRETLYSYLHETLGEQKLHRDTQRRITDKLSAISEDLKHDENERVKELEERRTQIGASRDRELRQMGGSEKEIERLDERERDLEKQLDGVRAENDKAERVRLQMRVAGESADIFSEILRLRTEEVREQLDTRIKELYGGISFKAYVPVLDPRFRLDLRTAEGESAGSVAKSTGENQILSLSFVGSVAEHARDRFEASKGNDGGDGLLSFQGGIFPVVMDSPFGSLDRNYQERVADAIPRLAPQVVVFVSKSQGMGAVQEEMGPMIEREYVIEFQTPKPDAVEETIELRSGAYRYISRCEGFERAEVVEVGG